MPDTFFTRMAGQFLERRRSTPFFLWIGFYVTHSPFRFPIEFRGLFDPASFAVPDIEPQDIPLIPPVFQELTTNQKRGILAAYYTSVAYMDRNIGLILDALDRSGLAEDTLIIFNSDHGYLLGQHGRFEKHCCYEEAIRAALIMRLPGLIAPARTTSAMLELIDVVPTILDLCGVDLPTNMQGRSIVSLLDGRTDRHRDHVVAEYADNAEAMVRTEQWKLVYSAGNRRRGDGYALAVDPPGLSIRLFDLTVDPGETTDVSTRAENASVINKLLVLLANHMRSTARDPEGIPDTDDVHVLLEHCLLPAEVKA
jgi:choline-sulfatase